MVKIANFFKTFNRNMRTCKSPSTMYMHDMVTIDITVFEMVRRVKAPPPPPRIVNFLEYPGLDRVAQFQINDYDTRTIQCTYFSSL